MLDDGVGLCNLPQVSPLRPFWPPGLLPDGSRELRARRGGFFSPSLDGGLPLFELFKPSWRSNSATRTFKSSITSSSHFAPPGQLRFLRFPTRR